jgi:hypothetical protein
MQTLAVAVPAAPAVPFALLALSSAIAFVVSWGLLHGWARTFGAAFQWLGNKGIDLSIRAAPDIHIHPFRFLLSIDQKVVEYLGAAVGATEHAMVTSFHKMIGIILWTAQETAGLATDVFNAVKGVEHSTVKTVTKVVTHTVVKPIHTAIKATGAISRAQWHALTHRVDVLAARVTHLARASSGAIAAPFPRIGRIEKTVKAQGKRLSKVEKALGAGVGVALLVKALSKLGLGFLRCPSVTKALRRRQCIDYDFLDSLLTGALLIVGTISLVEFAEEVGSVTDEAAGLIHGFLRDA